MRAILKACLKYLHPFNKVHINIRFEMYRKDALAPAEPRQTLTGYDLLNAELKRLVDAGKEVSAAQLELINLGKVRELFPDHWQVVEKKVHTVIHLILKKHLSADECFAQVKPDAYIILFSATSEEEARKRAQKINDEILMTFKSIHASLDLQTSVTKVDPEIIKSPEPLKAIEEKLEEAPKIVPATTTLPPPGGKTPLPLSVMTLPEKPPLPVTRDENGRITFPEGMQVIYRPVLDTIQRGFTGTECIPYLAMSANFAFEEYAVLSEEADDLLYLELDQMVLGKARLALVEKQKQLVICPVHYKTLSDGFRNKTYIQHCDVLPSSSKLDLIFDIVGTPKSITSPELNGLITHLKNFSKLIMARTTLDRQGGDSFSKSSFNYLSVDIQNSGVAEPLIVMKMKGFVNNAKGDKLKTYARGIWSPDFAKAGIGAGFSAMSGDALHKTLPSLNTPVDPSGLNFLKK